MPDGRVAVCVYDTFTALSVFSLVYRKNWFVIDPRQPGAVGAAQAAGSADLTDGPHEGGGGEPSSPPPPSSSPDDAGTSSNSAPHDGTSRDSALLATQRLTYHQVPVDELAAAFAPHPPPRLDPWVEFGCLVPVGVVALILLGVLA